MDITIFTIKNSVKFFEFASAITGTIYLYKYNNTSLKYFPYLLWFITISEFLGWYIDKTGNLAGHIDERGWIYNTWVYNILGFVTFTTLFYIYFKQIKTDLYKKWIKLFALAYIISFFINWIFIQKISNFIKENTVMPEIVGSIFLIITIIFFFIELLKSEKILVFNRMLLFWISVGLLLFYSSTIPFLLKYNGYMLIPGIHKLFLIIYVLAILMYLIFTFGFIWSKKEE